MLKALRAVFALAVSLTLVGLLEAQEGRQPGRRPEGGRGFQQFSLLNRLENMRGLELTADQKEKIAELKKEYEPKLKELGEKMQSILTDEQKKARDEAMRAARQAGKRGAEARDAIAAAMKLTDEQKKQMEETRKAMSDLQKEIREKVEGLLTDKQKEVLNRPRGGRPRPGEGGGDRPQRNQPNVD